MPDFDVYQPTTFTYELQTIIFTCGHHNSMILSLISLTRNEKYTVFQTIVERFIPVAVDDTNSSIYQLSRHVLQTQLSLVFPILN